MGGGSHCRKTERPGEGKQARGERAPTSPAQHAAPEGRQVSILRRRHHRDGARAATEQVAHPAG